MTSGAPPAARVWKLELDELDDDPAILSAAERERASRFVKPLDARRYAQAHCAVRRILGRLTNAAPERLTFHAGAAGKPALSWPRAPALDFSLSHSGSLALIATSTERRIGVDIEIRRPLADVAGMARLLMCEVERAAFACLTPLEQPAAFYDLWTRKEALLKATGRGFLDDPRGFALDGGCEPAAIVLARTRWLVARLDADARAAAAIAFEAVEARCVPAAIKTYRRVPDD